MSKLFSGLVRGKRVARIKSFKYISNEKNVCLKLNEQ